MATEKQIEANRRNAARSRGPRTPEGKQRSSLNALKHGLTAEANDVLPGEDVAEFGGRLDAFLRDLAPRNEVEDCMIRRAAILSWKLDRADRHELAVLNRKIRERAEVEQARHRERVLELRGRLLPSYNDFQQQGFDPTPARDLVREIESTAQGCRWLIECWEKLRQSVDRNRIWADSEEMAIVRLSGGGAEGIDSPAIIDLAVAARIMLMVRPTVALDADRWNPGAYFLDFKREALREACLRQPKTYAEAVQILRAAIDKAIARLEIIRDLRERDGDDWGADESAHVGSFDTSKEGEKIRRYQATTNREMIRNLESVSRLRLQAVKLEREERAMESARAAESSTEETSRDAVQPDQEAKAENRMPKSVEIDSQRNEPNSTEAQPEPEDREAGSTLREFPRNEPKLDLEGERIEHPRFGREGESPVPIPLRAAS